MLILSFNLILYITIMKNDLNNILYRQILEDINKVLEILEYQPTCSDCFPTFRSYNRIKIIETTLHNLVKELCVSDTLLSSFKIKKALFDDNFVPNFAEMFGKE